MKRFFFIILFGIMLLTSCSLGSSVSDTTTSKFVSTLALTSPPTQTPQATASPSPTASPTASPAPKSLYLQGYKIGIDPGHQDHQNSNLESVSPYYDKQKIKVSLGAKGIESGVREYIFNLEISFMLKEALEAQGAEVFMTREKHDVDISNQARARMVKEADCDIWIRVHANYSSDREKQGICMLTPKKRSVSTQIYEQSKILSGLIQQGVIQETGAFDHGLSYRSAITGFNWSRIPVTLIECGYMSNKDEDLLLQTEEYKLIIVEGIVQGMIDYFNNEPMPEIYNDAS